MFIKKISLTQYKSHIYWKLDTNKKIVFIVGKNGVGKSNILDAIYTLCYTKSYFSSSDKNCINHDKEFYRIEMEVENTDKSIDEVSILYKNTLEKTIKYNDKTHARLQNHIGIFPCVIISPSDTELINNGPEVRRKYFDGFISLLNPIYLEKLIDYQKLLRQRNLLLKDNRINKSLIETISIKMANLNKFISEQRKENINLFLTIFDDIYSKLIKKLQENSIFYNTNVVTEISDATIEANMNNDIRVGYTTSGVHRDDFEFYKDEKLLKTYGSQGEKKLFAVALKLAQGIFIQDLKKKKPILLLDDIFDKLDSEKVNILLDFVHQTHYDQIFVTDTYAERIQLLEEHLKEGIELIKL